MYENKYVVKVVKRARQQLGDIVRNLKNGNELYPQTNVWQLDISIETLIGCTPENYCLHLENQFTDDISWENHGEWHIDHIRPLASFQLLNNDRKLDVNAFKEAFHYTNTQPLWACYNLSKGARYDSQDNEKTNPQEIEQIPQQIINHV